MPPLKTFIIYASADREYRAALELQLKSLIDNGLVQLWSDKEILPGDVWDTTIKQKLLESELFLMLVSANFFNSNYIREKEFSFALEKLERGEAIIVPIIVRDCDWEAYEVIRKLQVLPPGGMAVNNLPHWHNHDAAWATVTREIRRLVTARFEILKRNEKQNKLAAEQQPARKKSQRGIENEIHSPESTFETQPPASRKPLWIALLVLLGLLTAFGVWKMCGNKQPVKSVEVVTPDKNQLEKKKPPAITNQNQPNPCEQAFTDVKKNATIKRWNEFLQRYKDCPRRQEAQTELNRLNNKLNTNLKYAKNWIQLEEYGSAKTLLKEILIFAPEHPETNRLLKSLQ